MLWDVTCDNYKPLRTILTNKNFRCWRYVFNYFPFSSPSFLKTKSSICPIFGFYESVCLNRTLILSMLLLKKCLGKCGLFCIFRFSLISACFLRKYGGLIWLNTGWFGGSGVDPHCLVYSHLPGMALFSYIRQQYSVTE